MTRSEALQLFVLLMLAGLIHMLTYGALQTTSAKGNGNCSETYSIDVTSPTQARWTMCWEERLHEGIILYDITYTPPNGPQRLVLSQANLAQIHVPYDDNGARLHDLSDAGLGGIFHSNLTPEECPGGTLLQNGVKNVLCMIVQGRGYAHKHYAEQLQGYSLTLYSVSQAGQYNYVVQWRFYDDGTIEPAVGATGSLQRYAADPAHGWPLNSDGTQYGVSHAHNYYWRLDFDLGGEADDLVEEFSFDPGSDQASFTLNRTALTTETARQVSAVNFRSWRIRDKVIANGDGHSISYHLEPEPAQIFRGPAYEPWTHNEFYVTRYAACERWASHNPTTGGCADNVSSFVNGESIDGVDLVVWYGLSFHHLPRDEDQDHMDSHWSSFFIRPRDWIASNPLVNVTPVPPSGPPNVASTLLSDFRAVWNQNQVQVSWETSAEINNAAFNLYRSTDGQNWSQIHTEPSQFPCESIAVTNPIQYSFIDTDISSSLWYFYKLEFEGEACSAESRMSQQIALANHGSILDSYLPLILK